MTIARPLFWAILVAAHSTALAQNSEIAWVNPFIGTGGHGHTFPGATVPFGMVQLSPDTRPDPGDWDGCCGYHFSDSVIYGFSHTHLSGTGVSDYCDVLLQPVEPGAGFSAAETASLFLKKNERAEAGFYQVELEKPNVWVELTASERVGFHRYNFAGKAYSGDILLDLKWRDLVLDAQIDLSRMDEGIITGHRFSRSWATDQRLFFFLKFSKKPSGVRQNGREQAIFEFKWTTNGNHAVVVECAISSVDVAGAEANWKAETTNFDFGKAKNRAQSAWQKQLSKIEIEGGSDRDRTVFYTALYHTMIAPNIFSDVDGRYRGRDQQVHQAQKGATMYTVFSLWDTYRALHPLMTILEPARVRDWMYTFWRQSEEGGKLPVWELAANETNCMIGNHSIPVIADAYLKGLVPDSLTDRLIEACAKTFLGSEDLQMEAFYQKGYLPSDEFPESVSKTLETAFDHFAYSKMVFGYLKSKGIEPDFVSRKNDSLPFEQMMLLASAGVMEEFSRSWRNVLNPANNHFQPKSNSTWLEPFDPTEVNFNFTEANSWQYGFLQHQFEEEVAAIGGQKVMISMLDSLFFTQKNTTGRIQADITGLVGLYAQGNEPSHHIPYLYNAVGQPWKCQQLVRRILGEHFSEKPDGLPGNDDCGQMSGWVVWAMLGMYPVCPVMDGYERGAPSFAGWKIWHGDGRVTALKVDGFSKTGFVLPKKRPDGFGERPMAVADSTFWGKTNHQILMQPTSILEGQPEWLWKTGPAKPHYLEVPPVPFVKKGDRVFIDPQTIELGCLDPLAEIRFTIDGSEPTEASAKYENPILIEKNTVVKAVSVKNEEARSQMTAHFTQQADRKNWKTTLQNQPNPQYTGRGDRGLIDGLRGGADFRSGGWQGFDGKELELVLDMGEAKEISKIGIGFLQDDNSWIFIPQMVFFETSLDGKNWKPASTVLAKRATTGPGEGFLEDFETTLAAKKQARFIKIKTQSYLTCPAWHKGVGSAAWLFADEIWVE